MQPLLLLCWLLLELAGYSAIFSRLLTLEPAAALFAAIALLLFGRAVFHLGLWSFAAGHTPSRRKIGFAPRLRLIVGEYLAFLLTFCVVLPLERLWMPADRLQPGRRVILLVHGYGCSRGVWWRLRRHLEAAGCTVASVSLFPPLAGLDALLPQLRQRIDEVCTATGAHHITLLGHSMGGLLCRALDRGEDPRIAGLITLATPHGGSELARFGFGQAARDMTPGSPWLNACPVPQARIARIAFRNPDDNYVVPPDHQRLPGAHNVDLPPVGHLAMLYDRRVIDLVVDACADR